MLSSRCVFESHLLFDRVRDVPGAPEPALPLACCRRARRRNSVARRCRSASAAAKLQQGHQYKSLEHRGRQNTQGAYSNWNQEHKVRIHRKPADVFVHLGQGPATRAHVGPPTTRCIAASCCQLCGGGPCHLGFRQNRALRPRSRVIELDDCCCRGRDALHPQVLPIPGAAHTSSSVEQPAAPS